MSLIRFQPIYLERVWGGRKIETLYGRPLPPALVIGESWELVDRKEAQSVVTSAHYRGQTLHDLWLNKRENIFGTQAPDVDRFPLLIKILDAQDKLSLQVHPPEPIAKELNSESKTEAWYFVETQPNAEIFLGVKKGVTESSLSQAMRNHTVIDQLNRYHPQPGEVAFIPAGCLHAIGGGNLIVEVQQNADTTYRLHDWDRVDAQGKLRSLHPDEAMKSIIWQGKEMPPHALLEKNPLITPFFSLKQQKLTQPFLWESDPNTFQLIFVIEGRARWGNEIVQKGEFVLVPAMEASDKIFPEKPTTLLITQWGV
ncbi:MAG: type I phosphomannose isomerase catalytic subunit [Verrucomicrobiia bacterium]